MGPLAVSPHHSEETLKNALGFISGVMGQTWTTIPLFESAWKVVFMDGKLISKLI
jgi:hypothetical protein